MLPLYQREQGNYCIAVSKISIQKKKIVFLLLCSNSLKGTHGDLVSAGVLQNLLGAAPQGNVLWGGNSGSR